MIGPEKGRKILTAGLLTFASVNGTRPEAPTTSLTVHPEPSASTNLKYPVTTESYPSNAQLKRDWNVTFEEPTTSIEPMIVQEADTAINNDDDFLGAYGYMFPRHQAERHNITRVDTTGTADIFAFNDDNHTAHGVPIQEARNLLSGNLEDAKRNINTSASHGSAIYKIEKINGKKIITEALYAVHPVPIEWAMQKGNLTIEQYANGGFGRWLYSTTGVRGINNTAVLEAATNSGGNAWGDGSGKFHQELPYNRTHTLVIKVEENQQPKQPEPTSVPDTLVGFLKDSPVIVYLDLLPPQSTASSESSSATPTSERSSANRLTPHERKAVVVVGGAVGGIIYAAL